MSELKQCPHCGHDLVVETALRTAERQAIRDSLAEQLLARGLKGYESATEIAPGLYREDKEPDWTPDGGLAARHKLPKKSAPGSHRVEEAWEPIAPASLSSQWATPLAIAVTTGLGIGVFSFPFWILAEVHKPVLFSWTVGGIAAGFMWFKGLEFFKEALFRTKNFTEEVFGADLDGDGRVGDPGWLSVDGDRARRNGDKSRAQQKREAVIRFVELIWIRQLQGRGTGQKALRGHELPNGYTVTDALHKEIGDVLVENGLAEQEGAGWRLVASPEEVAEAIRAW